MQLELDIDRSYIAKQIFKKVINEDFEKLRNGEKVFIKNLHDRKGKLFNSNVKFTTKNSQNQTCFLLEFDDCSSIFLK